MSECSASTPMASGVSASSVTSAVTSRALRGRDLCSDLDAQAFEVEHKARLAAERARHQAEAARDALLLGQREAASALKRAMQDVHELHAQKEAHAKEIEQLTKQGRDMDVLLAKSASDCEQMREERNAAISYKDIMTSTCDGAVAAKKSTLAKLEAEMRVRQALEGRLEAAKEEMEQRAVDLSKKDAALVGAQRDIVALEKAIKDEKQSTESCREQVNSLSARVDELKQRVHLAEGQLATAQESITEVTEAKEALSQVLVEQETALHREQSRRKKAEVQVHEAVKEVTTSNTVRGRLELQLEDVQRALELEKSLHAAVTTERDRLSQQLKGEQQRASKLQQELGETEAALRERTKQLEDAQAAAQSTSDSAISLSGDMSRRSEALDELYERLRVAESGRRVAEMAWREAEEARSDAQAARSDAEHQWHQLSEILARAEATRRQALADLLSERSARLLAQQTLDETLKQLQARPGDPIVEAAVYKQARLSLLDDMRDEQSSLQYIERSLEESTAGHVALLEQLQQLRAITSAQDASEDARESAQDASAPHPLDMQQLEPLIAQAVETGEAAVACLNRVKDTVAAGDAHNKRCAERMQSELATRASAAASDSGEAGCDLDCVVPNLLDDIMSSARNSMPGSTDITPRLLGNDAEAALLLRLASGERSNGEYSRRTSDGGKRPSAQGTHTSSFSGGVESDSDRSEERNENAVDDTLSKTFDRKAAQSAGKRSGPGPLLTKLLNSRQQTA